MAAGGERLETSDFDEIVKAVSDVYCSHEIKFGLAGHASRAAFAIVRGGPQPIVELRYERPVRVDAGGFPNLLLMQTCVDGAGAARQGSSSTALMRGQTVALSPSLDTSLDFDARFAQRSVRLDLDKAEALCSQWLGGPLDRPLRLELRPFSQALETAWAQAVDLLANYARSGIPLPASAVANLDEFILSLVLSQHPHNYSDALNRRGPGLPPRLVRDAEQLMRTCGAEVTVSAIAAELRVSLRSLEVAFQEAHGRSPNQFLREVRLKRVRETLLHPAASTSVTTAALENGFVHLARFSGYYKAAFGELPAQTLRRNLPRTQPATSTAF